MNDNVILEATYEDKEWIRTTLKKYWASTEIVIKGEVYKAEEYKAMIYKHKGIRTGLLIYFFDHVNCKIISLSTDLENKKIGTFLIMKLIDICFQQNCKRIEVITTNDNLKALYFYQKLGFRISGFYMNSITDVSRKLELSIPETAPNGIPIRDEIQLEYLLDHE